MRGPSQSQAHTHVAMATLLVGGAVGTAGLAAWSGATTLFQYNQGLWQFDKSQRQNRIHQAQGMAVSQVTLWREDLRDLFKVTNTKMDNYMTVSTLVMGFTIGMFMDYHLDPDTPTWLFLVAAIHNGTAVSFSLLSLCFSMYASLIVQMFETKVMCEVVRLPIPDPQALMHASAVGRHFEDPKNVRMSMRIPVFGSRSHAHKSKDSSQATLLPFVHGSPHMQMFQQMQSGWMPLANFARVCMLSSLTSMTYTLMYIILSRHLGQGRVTWGAGTAVLTLTCVNLLLQKVDFMISRREWFFKTVAHVIPPVLSYVIMLMTMLQDRRWADYGAPVVYFLHMCWLIFLLRAANPTIDTAGAARKSKFRLTILQDMQFGGNQSRNSVSLEEMSAKDIAKRRADDTKKGKGDIDKNIDLLPSPIVEDKLEDVLGAECSQDLEHLPWMVFRAVTSSSIIAFFLALCWAVVNVCIPEHHLGRPHEVFSTGAENYLDLGGDEARRLRNASTSIAELASQAPNATASSQEVGAWLRSLHGLGVTTKGAAVGIDGKTLRYIDQQGLATLGVSSAVERAKLKAQIDLAGKFNIVPRPSVLV